MVISKVGTITLWKTSAPLTICLDKRWIKLQDSIMHLIALWSQLGFRLFPKVDEIGIISENCPLEHLTLALFFMPELTD